MSKKKVELDELKAHIQLLKFSLSIRYDISIIDWVPPPCRRGCPSLLWVATLL